MPPEKWEPEWKWLLVAALAVVAANMFTAHNAYGQVVVYKDSVALKGMHGATICDSAGNPEIWVRTGQDSASVKAILDHEARHVQQMARFEGGCHALWIKYNTDWRFRLKTELDAYYPKKPILNNDDDRSAFLDYLSSFIWGYYIRNKLPASYSDTKEYVRNFLTGGSNAPP